jgi:hypothetical protein
LPVAAVDRRRLDLVLPLLIHTPPIAS